jgi:hypothetical protein
VTTALPVLGLIGLATVFISGIELGRRSANANLRINADIAYLRALPTGSDSDDLASPDLPQ